MTRDVPTGRWYVEDMAATYRQNTNGCVQYAPAFDYLKPEINLTGRARYHRNCVPHEQDPE